MFKDGTVEYAKIILRVDARESFSQIPFLYAIIGNFQQFLNWWLELGYQFLRIGLQMHN